MDHKNDHNNDHPNRVATDMTAPTSTESPARTRSVPPRRWVGFAVFAAVLLTAALWAPSLVFHMTFQRLVTTGDLGIQSAGLLNLRLEPLDPASAGERGEAWHQLPFGDVLVSVPPGQVTATTVEDKTLVVSYEDGKVLVDRFPVDLVHEVFLEEYRRVGGYRDSLPGAFLEMSPGNLLARVTSASPNEYEFGMAATERAVYAALICAKLRLWNVTDVERALSIAGERSHGVAILSDGSTRAIVATPEGVFVFTAIGVAGSREVSRQGFWLETLPLGPTLFETLKLQVDERYAEGHPVRIAVESFTPGQTPPGGAFEPGPPTSE